MLKKVLLQKSCDVNTMPRWAEGTNAPSYPCILGSLSYGRVFCCLQPLCCPLLFKILGSVLPQQFEKPTSSCKIKQEGVAFILRVESKFFRQALVCLLY